MNGHLLFNPIIADAASSSKRPLHSNAVGDRVDLYLRNRSRFVDRTVTDIIDRSEILFKDLNMKMNLRQIIITKLSLDSE